MQGKAPLRFRIEDGQLPNRRDSGQLGVTTLPAKRRCGLQTASRQLKRATHRSANGYSFASSNSLSVCKSFLSCPLASISKGDSTSLKKPLGSTS